jgi:V8-like Glu-specific endopeptidase
MTIPFELADLAEYEIIPPDQRVRITDTQRVPYRWVCSINVKYGSTLMRGSGVLVGPRHVLTAAHNVHDRAGHEPDAVHVVPARDERSHPFGRFGTTGIQTHPEWLKHRVNGNRWDIAMITLDQDASAAHQLGHWGSPTTGQGSDLTFVDPAFLAGHQVVVCGYPGDKCGGATCDPQRGWTAEEQADTMWSHFGPARFLRQMPGMLLHTADTHPGQSGSPVWILFQGGRRSLVGIHVGSTRIPNAARNGTVPVNRAVHLDRDMLTLVQGWM